MPASEFQISYWQSHNLHTCTPRISCSLQFFPFVFQIFPIPSVLCPFWTLTPADQSLQVSSPFFPWSSASIYFYIFYVGTKLFIVWNCSIVICFFLRQDCSSGLNYFLHCTSRHSSSSGLLSGPCSEGNVSPAHQVKHSASKQNSWIHLIILTI